MKNKFLKNLGVTLSVFLISSCNLTAFASTQDTYNKNLNSSEQVETYLYDIFNVDANQYSWTFVYGTNNLIDENLKIKPTGFGKGITSVDVFVTWGNGKSIEYNNLEVGDVETLVLYWNDNDYRVFVKTHGANGSVDIQLNDKG